MSDAEQAQPRPIRFFGTTWVNHDGGYPLRRAAVAVGSLAAAAAGAVVADFAYQGFDPAPNGAVLRLLFAAALAVCTVAAFRRTWTGFVRSAGSGTGSGTGSDAARGMMMIGFIGVLLAYFLRSLVEAPGEGLRRAEYERSLVNHRRDRTARSGNPARRRA